MKSIELTVYAILLLVAVGLAHSSWKGEEPTVKSSVVLFDPGAPGIEGLEWQGKTSVASLEVTGRGDDAETWVTAGKRKRLPAPPTPEGDDDDSASPEAAEESTPAPPPEPEYGEPELRSFPGSDAARNLVELYSPLTALRQFDGVDDAQLEGMGLLEPESKLTLRAGSKELVLDVGDKAYGSKDVYAREPGSTRVWLLSSKAVSPLSSASSSLRERDLLGFEPTDAVMAEIAAPDQAPVQAAHQGRHDKANSFWTSPETPEERDAALDALLKKLLQLRASNYLTSEETSELGELEPVLAAAFAGEKGPLTRIELARALDAERSRPGDPVFNWYARSPRSRDQWAKVSRSAAEELADGFTSLSSP